MEKEKEMPFYKRHPEKLDCIQGMLDPEGNPYVDWLGMKERNPDRVSFCPKCFNVVVERFCLSHTTDTGWDLYDPSVGLYNDRLEVMFDKHVCRMEEI